VAVETVLGLLGITLLAFGAACGYEYAGTKLRQSEVQAASTEQQPGQVLPKTDQYTVGLDVQESNGAVLVKWDRSAAPIQAALHGVLTVTTGPAARMSASALLNCGTAW
jgi:hypothetical protein